MASQAPRRAPVVCGVQTNMACAAAATRAVAEPLDIEPRNGAKLQIFDMMLPGFGVVPIACDGAAPLLRRGEVAVYEEGWFDHNPLVPGLYCYEYQGPANCNPDPAARRAVARRVVRVDRWKAWQGTWAVHPLGKGFSDFPLQEIHLTERLLGPIVGLYRPMVLS